MGGDVISRDSVNVPGPGHSRNDRSLTITISSRHPAGFVVCSHAGDDAMACRDYVRASLGLGDWHKSETPWRSSITPIVDPDPARDKMKQIALRTWAQSVNPIGTMVEFYLRAHRGLELEKDIASSVVRFHGSLYFDANTRLPGMVCLLRDIATDEPCGIHRTFLDRRSAEKLGRKMLGASKGAAIKFDAHQTISTTLTIGEGVETALSARCAGFRPTWALGSSGAVKAFPALQQLSELTILEENDPTSRRDVKACADRYGAAGKPVNVITSNVGNDFNDVWRAVQS
jgi:hypothetical protein